MAQLLLVVFLTFLLVLAPFTTAYPTALKYSVNQEFDYNLNANVDAKETQSSGIRTQGSYSTMKAIAASKCTQISGNQYLFVFNMFNTDVNVGQGFTRVGITNEVDAPQPLGFDMYYQQDNTGKIIKVYYQQGDDPYFVQVKLGAINSFQTSITAPQTTKRVLEDDPVGEHYSSFQGDGSIIGLVVNKTYSEKDFQKFPDANVKATTFSIQGKTSTAIHEKGYIYSSSVSEYSIFNRALSKTDIPKGFNIKVSDNEDTTGFDLSSSSNGVLSISLTGKFDNGLLLGENTRTIEQLENDNDMIGGTMIEQAARFLRITSTKHAWLKQSAPRILSHFLSLEKSDLRFPRMMNKLARAAREYSSEEVIAPTLSMNHLTPEQRSRLFAVLALVSDTSAENVLIEYGLHCECSKVQLHAIFAANSFMKPSVNLLHALNEIYNLNTYPTNQHAILYAMGAILSKDSIDPIAKQAYGTLFINSLTEAIKFLDSQRVIEYLNAIGNAGPSAVPVAFIPKEVFSLPDISVRLAAIEALRKYSDPKIIAILSEIISTETSEKVRQAASSLYYKIAYVLTGSSFPFNQSWSQQISFGGKQVNVVFDGLLFAGTNFDCNHPTFNYEGHTRAEATANAFGETKSAFLAEALYGKENGQLIGNKLYLRFWDNVLYDKTIPVIDCNAHVNELGHTAFGFSVSYTLWVSVIPVTFRASVLLQLDLKWGWNICDNQLSALVELIPSATLTVSGGAEINLLIIKAGISLDASFNAIVKPQVFVHGTQCQVGFNAVLQTTPMSSALVAYFAEKECKYVFFDCHWGKTHQKTLWSWQLAPKTQVLFNKVWDIKK